MDAGSPLVDILLSTNTLQTGVKQCRSSNPVQQGQGCRPGEVSAMSWVAMRLKEEPPLRGAASPARRSASALPGMRLSGSCASCASSRHTCRGLCFICAISTCRDASRIKACRRTFPLCSEGRTWPKGNRAEMTFTDRWSVGDMAHAIPEPHLKLGQNVAQGRVVREAQQAAQRQRAQRGARGRAHGRARVQQRQQHAHA